MLTLEQPKEEQASLKLKVLELPESKENTALESWVWPYMGEIQKKPAKKYISIRGGLKVRKRSFW